MSYNMNCGYGAYYEYEPHQLLGYGFGAVTGIRATFDPAKVWADAQMGGTIGQVKQQYDNFKCGPGPKGPEPNMCAALWAEMGRINAAGGRAARAIQQGLNELGYGPVTVDGVWGGESAGAWEQFLLDQNLPSGPGLVNREGIYKMGALLKAGETPGPQKAGLPTWGWLLLIAGGVAGVAMLAKKRKGRPATGKAMVPMR